MRRLMVPAGVAAAALLISACGGSTTRVVTQTLTPPAYTGTITSGTSTVRMQTQAQTQARTRTTPAPTNSEIEQAATRTAAEPGFRAKVSVSIRLPQAHGNPLTARGDGYFDPRSRSGTLDVAVELPGLLGLVGPEPTRVKVVGGDAYVELPSDIASDISSSDRWLESSLATLDLGNSLDPALILEQTARDATQQIPDQRATLTIDPATGLIRTIVLNWSEPGGYHVHVRLLLTGFRAQPATAAPAPQQTGSLESALQELGF